MNKKLEKRIQERDNILSRMAAWDARRKELDAEITELENLEIRALMNSQNLSLTELLELVRSLQEQKRTPPDPYDDTVADTAYHAPYTAADEMNTEEESDDEEI